MRKAVWLCLPFSASAALCRLLLPESALPLVMLCALTALAASLLLRGKSRLAVTLLACGVLLGSVCAFVQQRFVIRPAEALTGERRTVTARVTDYPDVYDGSAYVTVRLTEPGIPGVKCRLASYVEGELDYLRPGDELTAAVRFQSAAVRNGEEIDAYFSQNIFSRAVCTDEPAVTGRWSHSWLYWPKMLCHAVSLLCERAFPADASPFMSALLTGDKSALYRDGERYYDLCEAGLAHVVAVSGMHIAYLMGLVFLLGGRGPVASAVAMPVLVFFAAMTGFTPSVTRAVFMQMCLLSAPLFKRENDPFTALSVVLALILFINPSAAAGAGLQLSFASMAGISLVSQRMYTAIWRRVSAWKVCAFKPARLALGFMAVTTCASLGAQIFSLPLAAAHFGYVSTVSPVSGPLCLWMISALYVGGYVTAGLTAALPAAGAWVGGILAWGVRYIFLAVKALGYFPCEAVYMSNPLFVLWLAAVYALFITAWLRSRRTGSFRMIAPLCLSLILLWGSGIAVRLTWSDDLTVTVLDVGQGESVALTCGERAVLVDCGGSYMTRDAGEAAVRYLRGRQRRRLDALILSHLHADHVNGAARVLAQMDVDTLYLPAQADEDGYLPEILRAAREAGTAVEYVTENMILVAGDMELTIWAPLLPGGENENCLVVMARQGDFETFITGDSPAAAEALLAAKYALPDAEVLVAGHHGSDTSTCREFIEAIRPDLAVISVGYNNYGHPSPRVTERLEGYNIKVLRTDLEGNITVKAGG